MKDKISRNIKNRFGAFGGAVLATASSFVAGAAMALPPDVSDATDALTAGNGPIAELGLASLVMIIGVVLWKRFRRAA